MFDMTAGFGNLYPEPTHNKEEAPSGAKATDERQKTTQNSNAETPKGSAQPRSGNSDAASIHETPEATSNVEIVDEDKLRSLGIDVKGEITEQEALEQAKNAKGYKNPPSFMDIYKMKGLNKGQRNEGAPGYLFLVK